MATKCITITTEAYDRLAVLKDKSESFSEVIKRLTKRSNIMDLCGILSNNEAIELKKNVVEIRKRMRSEVERTARKLQ